MSAAAAPLNRTLRFALGRHWVTAGAFALVAGTGFAQGGYFPEAWGWPALGAAWAAALAALSRERLALSRAAVAAVALLAGLVAWAAVGIAWSIDSTQTVLEVERDAVYVAALLAALLWGRRRPERLLHGTWAAIAIVCGWSLLTRLVPDRFGVIDAISGYRLSEPVGYWNTLGLLAGMGALLALGLATRARSYAGRVAAGLSLPPLVTALYFTYSRGAWAALGFGLLAVLLVDRRRLQLLVVALALAPWTALAVWWAATSPALTTLGLPFGEMTAQGHRLLLRLVLLALVSGGVAAALRPLERRLVLPERLRPVAAVLVVLAVVAAGAAVTVRYGSPVHLTQRTWNAFANGSTGGGSNLNNRLFHLNGTGRVTQWRVAWHEAQQYPWLGSGAGTYEGYWDRNRPVASRIRDVHNLYLETLAEQGPLGLALLVAALALPLAAVVRVRRRPLASAALGAYVAYLLHAAVDWDWEIPAATLACLLCGAMLLSSQRRRRRHGSRSLARGAVLAAAAVLAGLGLYTIASRIPLQRLGSEAAAGRWDAAATSAHRASELAPWSSEPWIRLGEAQLNAGRRQAAVVSFRKAVGADPEEWLPWHDLARAATGSEQLYAQARAVALNPLSP